ncbi:hypothetical protein E3N88_19319 [Mikania micrantha]|uniref:Dynamin stalk domain-containing protein n=1 Tax=Mikania micrantha TaxID=192012 RepID=A0A5N6NPT3_9ASTR|nr:hypothetical protein E3N88_19319 [Mikania micrantha]
MIQTVVACPKGAHVAVGFCHVSREGSGRPPPPLHRIAPRHSHRPHTKTITMANHGSNKGFIVKGLVVVGFHRGGGWWKMCPPCLTRRSCHAKRRTVTVIMAIMESLIGLVNRIQRACTALGHYGGGDTAFSSLWDALRSVAVVGGQPNSIILAISPANQDIATSDAMKLAREVDPSADINENTDMIYGRRREREYFATSPDYGHLANKMGSEYLAKLLSQISYAVDYIFLAHNGFHTLEHFYVQHLESVIKVKIPGIISLINKGIDEMEAELDHLGRPIAIDAGAQLYTILELCRAFDKIFKEHLDGGRPGGDRIYGVFDHQLPAALRKLPFDKHLSLQNVRKLVSEADGYQPHLIAPEQGYIRLIEESLNYFRRPAEASVDAVHFVLKELVRKSIGETEVRLL